MPLEELETAAMETLAHQSFPRSPKLLLLKPNLHGNTDCVFRVQLKKKTVFHELRLAIKWQEEQ